MIFFMLYVSYTYINGIGIVSLRSLNEDIYLPAEFAWDRHESVKLNSFGDWVREIWSFTK